MTLRDTPNKYTAEQLAEMTRGRPPKGPDDQPMEIHHVQPLSEGGSNDFTNMAFMSRQDHRLGGNMRLNHPNLWK